MRKYSFIGLSLLAISSIIAAFVPSKGSSKITINVDMGGVIDDSTGLNNNIPDPTCRERMIGDSFPNCSYTSTLPGPNGSSTDILADSNSVSIAANSGSATTEPLKG